MPPLLDVRTNHPSPSPIVSLTLYWKVWHWMQRRLSLSGPLKLTNLLRHESQHASNINTVNVETHPERLSRII